MVAMCDIMGFGALIGSHPLSRVVDEFVPRLFSLLENCITQETPVAKNPSISDLQNLGKIGIAWFSDTILLYGLDDTDESCRRLIETVGWLTARTLFEAPRTRIRSGISYGEFYEDKERNLFLGKSIVEANQVEKQQEWVGGALSKSAEERVRRMHNSDEWLASDWWLTEYSAPAKVSKHPQLLSNLAINWPLALHPHNFDLDWSDESPEPTEDEWTKQSDVCKKWYNTRLFHRKVCRRCGTWDSSE